MLSGMCDFFVSISFGSFFFVVILWYVFFFMVGYGLKMLYKISCVCFVSYICNLVKLLVDWIFFYFIYSFLIDVLKSSGV